MRSGFPVWDFPAEEYDTRITRTRDVMRENGLDALLVSDEVNVRYLTGYLGPTKNRPGVVILTQDHTLLLVDSFGASVARFTTWVGEGLVEYSLPFTSDVLVSALRKAGIGKGTVGLERDDTFFHGFRPAVQAGDVERLSQAFPGLKWVDASHPLWRLRIVKTPAEIAAVRQACTITDRAYADLFAEVHGGMSEREVTGLLISAMMRHGADLPFRGKKGPCAFVVLDSGRPGGEPPTPTGKRLASGDVLRIDCGAVYHGYCADYARSGVVGGASEEQRETWKQVDEAVRKAVDSVKPGRLLGTIPTHWHGVGLDHVEAPFRGITGQGVHGHLPMEPGMVLSVEEIRVSPGGQYFHCEETLVVTQDGCEVLSRFPEELYTFPISGGG